MESVLFTDNRLLKSALSLYSKYGLQSITMDDLCRELGISKKTLYLEVEDKNDLIRKVLEYEKALQRRAMERMSDSNMNAIDELIHVNKQIHASQTIHSPTFYLDLKKYHHQIYQDWIDYKRMRMYELIKRNLVKGISEGYYRKDLDVNVISKLHMARTEMMHSSEIIGNDEGSTTNFFNEVFKYHIHGICNEKGLAYYKSREKEITSN